MVRCSAGCRWVRLVELRASVAGGRGRGRGVAAAGVRRANWDVAFVEGVDEDAWSLCVLGEIKPGVRDGGWAPREREEAVGLPGDQGGEAFAGRV